jgi:energy-coupling factor transporter ATP-binding protein EcfA2
MEIKLKNIGIVKDSTISVNGLTVITGKNNSGKTTVGKAVYALLDAVSSLEAKARRDRAQYVLKRVEEVRDCFDVFRYLGSILDGEEGKSDRHPLSKYPLLRTLLSHNGVYDIPSDEFEDFARKLSVELRLLDVKDLAENEFVRVFMRRFSKSNDGNMDVASVIGDQRDKAVLILDELFVTLQKDPHLIAYARESINQTLRSEFANQIQPVSVEVDSSRIEISDESKQLFSVPISNNKVINDGNPVYLNTPYKKVYFIDNPFLWDDPTAIRRYLRNPIDADADSLLNPGNILSHCNKLRQIIRRRQQPTILEQTVLNEALELIKGKINSVLPGTFEFSSEGDYYVVNGSKLKLTNLATGSKMFSVIKLLLELGEIDKTTMLILDEPEAHLHPEWQNKFAEIIVLLVKELKVNILLTTHSSNFVLALDAYMRKYEIEAVTNFYQTEPLECGMVEYKCVNNSINAIYQDFLEYMSQVKILRNNCIRNVGDN